jgi:hypothetical protein
VSIFTYDLLRKSYFNHYHGNEYPIVIGLSTHSCKVFEFLAIVGRLFLFECGFENARVQFIKIEKNGTFRLSKKNLRVTLIELVLCSAVVNNDSGRAPLHRLKWNLTLNNSKWQTYKIYETSITMFIPQLSLKHLHAIPTLYTVNVR